MSDEEFLDDGTADLIDEESRLVSLEELSAATRHLMELRAERDRTKLAADEAKKAHDEYQAEFFREYKQSPLKKSVHVDVEEDQTVQLTPVRTHYGRIIDRAAAEAYFRERMKTKEFVKEDFRMGRLHELVRECIEQKKPLPPGVDFYTKEYFRITEKD